MKNKKKYNSIFKKKNNKPYIIAEIGVNHECSILKAKKMIFLAKKGGADAVKFQSYKANLIASKNSPAYWDTKKEKTKSQYDLFKKYDSFGENEFKQLYTYCKKINIEFSSTPFDINSVNYLNKYLKFFKISSSDITNFPLLEKISNLNKPVILSTGASEINEIEQAIKLISKKLNKEIIIMHCILSYPTCDKDANLLMIKNLAEKFPKNIIGYSDHTIPDNEMHNLLTAYTLGARVIEKHFTFNKKLKGNDHYHSMDYKDLKKFNSNVEQLIKSLGEEKKKVIKSELRSRKFARRSLVLNRDLKKGEKISKLSLVAKRPGTGISPIYIKHVIGKVVKSNLKEDHVLKWNDIN